MGAHQQPRPRHGGTKGGCARGSQQAGNTCSRRGAAGCPTCAAQPASSLTSIYGNTRECRLHGCHRCAAVVQLVHHLQQGVGARAAGVDGHRGAEQGGRPAPASCSPGSTAPPAHHTPGPSLALAPQAPAASRKRWICPWLYLQAAAVAEQWAVAAAVQRQNSRRVVSPPVNPRMNGLIAARAAGWFGGRTLRRRDGGER